MDLWKVIYDDGDAEEFDTRELKEAGELYQEKRDLDPKKDNAAAISLGIIAAHKRKRRLSLPCPRAAVRKNREGHAVAESIDGLIRIEYYVHPQRSTTKAATTVCLSFVLNFVAHSFKFV